MTSTKQKHLSRLSILILYSFSSSYYLTIVTASNASAPYIPTDHIALSCGSSGISKADDGLEWTGDIGSKFGPFSQSHGAAKEAKPNHLASTDKVPYTAARISRSSFTYTFPLTAGPKFIRLFFYPASYSAFRETEAFFSLKSAPYTLLHNFSAYLVAASLTYKTFSREFCINVEEENQVLNATFTPFPSSSGDSYAFVNGVEIVSAPTNLLYTPEGAREVTTKGQGSTYQIKGSTALETMYRLNVGGPPISAMKDSGMFRFWSDDVKYVPDDNRVFKFETAPVNYTELTPAYIAPEEIYRTSRTSYSIPNLTWILPVDSGFKYLVRLHFCEMDSRVTKRGDRRFNISIDTRMAESADVIEWSGGNNIPVYRDYLVKIGSEGTKGKYNLSIVLIPTLENSKYAQAFLNGIEIFKLNNTDASLAGQNPELPPDSRASKSKKTTFIAIGAGAIVGLGLLSLLFYTIFRLRRKSKDHYYYSRKSRWWSCCPWGPDKSKSARTKASSLPEELCSQFTLAEIKKATDNFNENCIIGRGGFGNVYKGNISDLENAVAIKRLNPMSRQGAHEFRTEIEMLSNLRHLHLVSLIGYCNDGGEMILVYEYMTNGTLSDYLYDTDKDPLSWKQRLNICIGAARGLDYLHSGAAQKVIHRDVKTTNILLDDKWVAKVSDFGLSKIGPTSMPVDTMVKGTLGYLDPEYYRRQQLTEKCDVYSFGVVLLEVLCARKPLNPKLGKMEANLTSWAKICIQKGTFDQIIDPYLIGKVAPVCLRKFVEIAMSCVQDQGTERPTMSDVADKLEFALRLQETAETAAEGAIVDAAVLYRDISFSSAVTGASYESDSGMAMDSSTSGYTGTGTSTCDCTTSKATNSAGV